MRESDYPIQPMILNRSSPRAMSGEELTDDELFPLFEAARWAPSSSNSQPWRIFYVKRNTSGWEVLFNLLVDFNKKWCVNAAVLGLFFAKRGDGPNSTHAYDTGAAWENLALEGTSRGLVVHGMAGFDYDKAKTLVPEGHDVLAMFAVGKKGPISSLPPELQKREVLSTRKKMEEFVRKIEKSSGP